MAETDSRNSLKHILADEPVADTIISRPRSPPRPPPQSPSITAAGSVGAPSSVRDDTEDQSKDAETAHYTSTTQTTRRNANGSVSSVYSGNKIKHLKKEDGLPLWRKDIQFEFLQLVFGDEQRVFTQYSDKTKGHTFAEIYIDAMAKSSKTSKTLKEKLAQDHQSAVSMAMVCLLVNVGRMNTTLNFFPEMRAQLRTYHSIPALQAYQDPNAYKQLQDAPRLKSILKGASEDEPQPGTIDEIKAAAIPRTNPVNLIFVLAQYAPKISEVHFTPPRDFFDLVMRPTLSSKTRAQAFLWLLWWYLESDFTQEDSQRNPFGPGQEGENTDEMTLKVPPLEVLTEDQAALENVDTEEELSFGELKRKERIAIVASEPSPAMTALKRARKERSLHGGFSYMPPDNEGTATPSRDYQSPVPQGSTYSNTLREHASSDHTRSPSPAPQPSFQAVNLAPKPPGMNISSMINTEDGNPAPKPIPAKTSSAPIEKKKGPGRGNWRRNKDKATPSHHEPHPLLPNTGRFTFVEGSPSHAPASTFNTLSPETSFHTTLLPNPDVTIPGTPSHGTKRSRPLTHHQVAISEYRRSRIQHILDRGMRKTQRHALQKRNAEGSLVRAWKRIRSLPSGWDSEEEENRVGREGEDEKPAATSGGAGNAADGNNGGGGEAAASKGSKNATAAAAKEAASLRAQRPVGAVWMAGYVLPGMRETEDCGEMFSSLGLVMKQTSMRFEGLERGKREGIVRPRLVRRASSVFEEEEEEKVVVAKERPRLVRKSGGVASGRKGKKGGRKSGGGPKRRGTKSEVKAKVDGDVDGDGDGADEMDLDGEAEVGGAEAELDEEDRELLGEVDADESADEDGDGDGDGDAGEDDDDDGVVVPPAFADPDAPMMDD